MKLTKKAMTSQAGFTLVELAVVMIIIGLLIGGVLKGQELIANAQVTSTVAQIKGIDAATTTFRDMFDVMPGDMATPAARLPNCAAAPCNIAGNGDSLVNQGGGFAAAPAVEELGFWAHLNAADLLSGLNPIGGLVWGGNFPAAEIGGGFHVGFSPGNVALTAGSAPAANMRRGHYLALHNTPGGAVAATGVITPNQLFRIDSKLDDGQPLTGNVTAAGAAAGAAGCASATGVYNESVPAANCNAYVRFQN
jgi:prepilin-type N-terminal cleavage/methylation domain-containing protein